MDWPKLTFWIEEDDDDNVDNKDDDDDDEEDSIPGINNKNIFHIVSYTHYRVINHMENCKTLLVWPLEKCKYIISTGNLKMPNVWILACTNFGMYKF